MRRLFQLFALTALLISSAAAQCTSLVFNPLTRKFDCTGAVGPAGPAGANGAAGSGNNALCADASGSTTTYTCPTPTPTVTTLSGLIITFTPQTTNTGASTVNVSSLGAKSLVEADGTTAIPTGALVAAKSYSFAYDGTSFRLMLPLQSALYPTFNQNTTGTAANVTGVVPEANGGTGASNTTGAAGHVLRSNGTHYVDASIQAADVPTLNQNTSGTAAALGALPTQCSSQFATGVAANGNANCTNTVPAGTVVGTSDTQTLTNKTFTNPALGAIPSVITQTYTNDTVTGTAANHLVKINGTNKVVKMATTDSSGAIGLCSSGCGTAGSGVIAVGPGTFACTFDAGITNGNWVQISSTVAGDCHDAGATIPTSGDIIGKIVDATNASAGTYNIVLQIRGGGSGGGGGAVSSVSGDGTFYTNSGSAGAVTLALGNATAHQWWGNNTGSTAAPGYESITAADVPTLNQNTTGTAAALGATPSQCSGQFATGVAANGNANCTNTVPAGTVVGTADAQTLTNKIYINPSLGAVTSVFTQDYSNNGTTGTTANKLVKLSGANQIVLMATTDTSGSLGICFTNCGTTGTGRVAIGPGTFGCVFDGGVTNGDWVQISSITAGDCHDAGATLPTSGDILGLVVDATNGVAGTYNIALQIRGATGAGGSVQFKSNGTNVGSPRNTINYPSPIGLVNSIVDTGTQINVGQNVDFTTVQGMNSCVSASGSGTTYTATCTGTLTSLANPTYGKWIPDVNGTGGATTLALDANGAKSVKLWDGTTNPVSGDIVTGRSYPFWYDGTVIRITIPLNSQITGGGGGAVTTVTGDGALISNSSSTGAVALTLGNAAAHKWWGNSTGSTTAPSYQTLTAADMPVGFPNGVNVQTTSYTLTATDNGKLVVMNCASACTVTLFGTPTSAYYSGIMTIGASDATVSLNSKNYNGAANVPGLDTYKPMPIWSDGTNYFGDAPLFVNNGIGVTRGSGSYTIGINSIAADSVFMNATGGSAVPAGVALPTSGTNGCAGASNALTYNTTTHALGCNTISGSGSGTVNAGTQGQLAWYATSTTAVSGNANFALNSGGTALASWNSIATAGLGTPTIGWVSNLTGQTAALGSTTLLSSATAGMYRLTYYADQATACASGGESFAFNFNWTDASNARAAGTGPLNLSSSQTTANYLSGVLEFWAGSASAVTYSSTLSGSCTSGAYDVHVTLERLQ